VPGSLPQTICRIYRTFSTTIKPQTTNEITEAATSAKIVRFFSFSSFNPETTKKVLPYGIAQVVMRINPPQGKGRAHFVTVSIGGLGDS
jgi:hypothetical protein